MRTNVYIDGFNFYYGAVKNTPHKWLDLRRFLELAFPKHSIVTIKYFTALVSARPSDADQPVRQQIYLRALQTVPNLEIIYGHFLVSYPMMHVVDKSPGIPKFVKVEKTEEKGSDVNLATHFLYDGVRDLYDAAILVTNDSDLVEPLKIVRHDLKKDVIVVNPHQRKPSAELAKYATFIKQVRTGTLAASQFPAAMTDSKGTFQKPAKW